MQTSIFYLILLSSYCYCEELIGGWTRSEDDSLKIDCLNKALSHINGAEVHDQMRSEASKLICRTQIVNGLNIKCDFVLRGTKWQCSYYKSFIQTLETQLEQCKQLKDEEQVDEQIVPDQEVSNEGEKEEQQPLIVKENDDEEQQQPPMPITELGEKENQGDQEAPVSDNVEEDDEAAVDAMKIKMSEQVANNEDEQQQQQQQKKK